MVIDEELEKKGSLMLGLSMILSAIAMYAVVMPIVLKLVEETIIAVPLIFLCALFGYPMLAAVLLVIMISLAKRLAKDHI
jgi:H+/gluconate symporter-like permease